MLSSLSKKKNKSNIVVISVKENIEKYSELRRNTRLKSISIVIIILNSKTNIKRNFKRIKGYWQKKKKN